MIHLYGVVDELEELPALTGLGDVPLENRRVDGLELVVSTATEELPAATEEALIRHAQVVEELMERCRAILPAQFGRAFSDEEELQTAVRSKARDLERGLNRVAGCAEFGLRVLGEPPERPGRPDSGRDYMQAKLAEAAERARVADEFHEPLARLSRESARFGGPGPDLLATAYLVPRERIPAFREHVRRLEAAHADLTVVCTGPWPPYTFAAGRGERE